MDRWVVVALVAVLVPVGVLWALAKSASLRGPAPRPIPRRPVDTLVTEAIPEERPEDEDDDASGYQAEAPSPPASD